MDIVADAKTTHVTTILSFILNYLDDDSSIALRYVTHHSTNSKATIEEWSYRKLLTSALLCAKMFFPQHTVTEGTPTSSLPCAAIMVEEGPALAISQLAALLAGFVVVPVSPQDPPSRIQHIFEDVSIAIAIVPNEKVNTTLLQAQEVPFPIVLASEILSINVSNYNDDGVTSTFAKIKEVPKNTVSHIYFTSGSTGKPKGCISTHEALVNYCLGKNQCHNVNADSVVFVASPHTFDPSFGDMFATWMMGATVACATRNETFTSLGKCLYNSKATHVLTTPALLETMPNGPPECYEKLPILSVVALGGEATTKTLARKWLPHLDMLLNTYGTTECCVYQTFSKIERVEQKNQGKNQGKNQFNSTSINNNSHMIISNPKKLGTAIPGNILIYAKEPGNDPTNCALEGSGELAELYISGPQVGLGYLNQPELTSEKFLRKNNTIYFRTGDIVRMDLDGPILLGRRDSQIKLNGQRVELGEVEAGVLRAVGAEMLTSAAAVLLKGKESFSTRHPQRLVIWCVPASTTALCLDCDVLDHEVDELNEGSNRKEEKVEALKTVTNKGRRPDIEVAPIFHDCFRWLIQKELPLHMIPSRLGFLSSLPVTSSGKIARKPLLRRGPPLTAKRQQSNNEKKDSLEAIVSTLWSDVLGVPIFAGGHFTEMGGDSLAALRVCQRISSTLLDEKPSFAGESLGSLSPLELLKRPRISEYVRYLRSEIPNLLSSKSNNIIALSNETQDTPMSTTNTEKTTITTPFLDEGSDLLYRAALYGARKCVKRLLQVGISPHNYFGSTPLHAACVRGNLQSARILLSFGGASCNSKNNHGATPLILAASVLTTSNTCSKHVLKLIQLLLENGAQLSSVDDSGQSVLHAAARTGQSTAVLKCLLAATLDRKKGKESKALQTKGPIALWKDRWGRTALHWGSINGHRAVCAFLSTIEEGPQTCTMKDNRGERPVDCAERRALCSAKERPNGARSSVWGDIAKILGGSGSTKNLKKKL
jgi:acyl-CoA synthetase (AMP-forming)/AMP-acid ligase II/ankyrin repeat protein